MRTYFFQFFISFSLIFNFALQASAACALPYSDVEESHWAYRYVEIMHCRKLMKGITYDIFGGDHRLNRFQFAEILSNILGNRDINRSMIIIIDDVLPNSKEYKYVTRAVQAGLIEMDDSTSFEGLRPVTRYEFSKSMDSLLRLLTARPPLPRKKDLNFSDVDSQHEDIVNQIANLWQLTSGYSNKTFKGTKFATRYEALVMLTKAGALIYEDIKRELAKPMPTPPPSKTVGASTQPKASGTPKVDTNTLDYILGSPKPKASPKAITTPKPKATVTPKPKPTPVPKATKKPIPKPSKRPLVKKTPTPVKTRKATPKPKSSGGSKLDDLEALLNKPKTRPTPKIDTSKLNNIFGKPKASAKPTPKATEKPRASAKPKINLKGLTDIFGKPKASAKPTPKATAKPKASAKPKINLKSLENLLNKPKAKPSIKPVPKVTAKPVVRKTIKPVIKTRATPKPKPTPKASSSKRKGKMTLADLENELKNLSSRPKTKTTFKPTVIAKASNKPKIKPAGPDSLIKVPLPSAKPKTSPSVKPKTEYLGFKQGPLNNRLLLGGLMNLVYDEKVPSSLKQALKMPDSEQTVSGDAGATVNLGFSYWFEDMDIKPWDKLGIDLNVSTLGGITFTSNSSSQTAELTDMVNADLAIMYKAIASPQFDLALGLDNYYRMTSSSNDPRSHYFLAARSYIGIGGRLQTAYRIWEPFSIELSIAPHFVIQDLSNIALPNLPQNRFDVLVNLMMHWNMFKMGDSDVSLDFGYKGSVLLDIDSDGSQMLHGAGAGIGFNF